MSEMSFDKPAAPVFLVFMATFTALCLGPVIRGRKERTSKIQGKKAFPGHSTSRSYLIWRSR